MQTVAWASLQNWVLVYGVQKHPSRVTLTCTQTSLQKFLKQERETTLHKSDYCSYLRSKCFSLQLKKGEKKTLYSLQLILVCAFFLIILWSVWGLSLVLSYTGVAKKIKFKIFCTHHSTQYFVVLLCHLLSTNNHLNPPFTNEDEKKKKNYRNHW